MRNPSGAHRPPQSADLTPSQETEDDLVDQLQAALLTGQATIAIRTELPSVQAQRAAIEARSQADEQARRQAVQSGITEAAAARVAWSRASFERLLAGLQPPPFPTRAGSAG